MLARAEKQKRVAKCLYVEAAFLSICSNIVDYYQSGHNLMNDLFKFMIAGYDSGAKRSNDIKVCTYTYVVFCWFILNNKKYIIPVEHFMLLLLIKKS